MDFEFKANDTQKHTAAHVMAAAVKRLYPNVKIGIGPVTKTGFFYDFELDKELTEKSFPLIEKNCEDIIRENLPMKQVMYGKADAINLLLQMGQVYKAEMVKALPDEQVSFYKLGEEFFDPDRGPHLAGTGHVYKIKLTRVEKVNWNNDPSRPVMYRVHGVTFTNETEFSKYENAMKLQVENSFESIGISEGLILNKDSEVLTSKGNAVIKAFFDYSIDQIKEFDPIHMTTLTSSSNDFVQKTLDNEFNKNIKSYKDLPAVFTAYVESGNSIKLNNLSVYSYSNTNDAISNVNRFIEHYIDLFNYTTNQSFSVDIRCANLDAAIVKSISILLQNKIVSHDKVLSSSVKENEVLVDFKVTTDMGTWILATMRVSNEVETRFKDSNNSINSTVNSNTTFFASNIIEYLYQNKRTKIPFQFQPVQVVCIPQRKEQYDFTKSIQRELRKLGYRSDIDLRSKSLRGKIRSAEQKNIPFILVIGKKEELNKSASIRHKHVEVGLIALDNILEFINSHADR